MTQLSGLSKPQAGQEEEGSPARPMGPPDHFRGVFSGLGQSLSLEAQLVELDPRLNHDAV